MCSKGRTSTSLHKTHPRIHLDLFVDFVVFHPPKCDHSYLLSSLLTDTSNVSMIVLARQTHLQTLYQRFTLHFDVNVNKYNSCFFSAFQIVYVTFVVNYLICFHFHSMFLGVSDHELFMRYV